MRGPLRGLLVAALVLCLAGAAGCGGGDNKAKNDYVGAVNRAQSEFVAVVDDSEARLSGNSQDAETATQLDAIRAAADKVVRRLRTLKPPGGVSTLHASLVREAEGLVAAFRKAGDAYRSGDPAQILTAKVQLGNDVTRLNDQLDATIQALNSKLHG
jgi:hypothetical protein